MISSQTEYQKAREELEHLNLWLSQLENGTTTVQKSFTVASIRKMISRLQEELAEYEVTGISTPSVREERTESNDGGVEQET